MRLTGIMVVSPIFTAFGTPAFVRIALVLSLSLLAFARQSPAPEAVQWLAHPAGLLGPAAVEFGLGALMGLSTQLVLAGFAVAGRLMDVQIGFSMASIFDPLTKVRTNAMGALMNLVGVTLFVASDAHLELVRLVDWSIDAFPLGQIPALDDPMRPLLAARWMFLLGLTLAAPLALTLLLTDLILGVTSRNMPQMNVLMMSIPVKIVVGFTVLALAVRLWGGLVIHAFSQVSDAMGLL